LLSQFKPDGPPGLFLPNGRPIDGIAIRSNVLNLKGDDIATSQLAVDGQIEHGQITRSLVDLELGPDSLAMTPATKPMIMVQRMLIQILRALRPVIQLRYRQMVAASYSTA
jgi:hypothetical protein